MTKLTSALHGVSPVAGPSADSAATTSRVEAPKRAYLQGIEQLQSVLQEGQPPGGGHGAGPSAPRQAALERLQEFGQRVENRWSSDFSGPDQITALRDFVGPATNQGIPVAARQQAIQELSKDLGMCAPSIPSFITSATATLILADPTSEAGIVRPAAARWQQLVEKGIVRFVEEHHADDLGEAATMQVHYVNAYRLALGRHPEAASLQIKAVHDGNAPGIPAASVEACLTHLRQSGVTPQGLVATLAQDCFDEVSQWLNENVKAADRRALSETEGFELRQNFASSIGPTVRAKYGIDESLVISDQYIRMPPGHPAAALDGDPLFGVIDHPAMIAVAIAQNLATAGALEGVRPQVLHEGPSMRVLRLHDFCYLEPKSLDRGNFEANAASGNQGAARDAQIQSRPLRLDELPREQWGNRDLLSLALRQTNPGFLASMSAAETAHLADRFVSAGHPFLALELVVKAGFRPLADAIWDRARASHEADTGENALHVAIRIGEPRFLESLQAEPALMRRLVAESTREGDTAMHFAARSGRAGLLRSLRRDGAAAGAKNHLGRTPLMEAARTGQLDAVRALREGKLSVRNRIVARWTGRPASRPADAPASRRDVDAHGMSALMFAARSGNVHVFSQIAGKDDDRTLQDADGLTAIGHATASGDAAIVEAACALGLARSAPKDVLGRTPLMIAALEGSEVIASRLLEEVEGREGLAAHELPDGRTLLMVSAGRGHADLTRDVLVRYRAHKSPLLEHDQEGRTALDHAMEPPTEYALLEILRAAHWHIGASSNGLIAHDAWTRIPGLSAAIKAVVRDRPEHLQVLLEMTDCIKARDDAGRTLLSHAVSEGRQELVRRILTEFPRRLEDDPKEMEGQLIQALKTAVDANASDMVSLIVSRLSARIANHLRDLAGKLGLAEVQAAVHEVVESRKSSSRPVVDGST